MNPFNLNPTEAEVMDMLCLTGSTSATADYLGMTRKAVRRTVQKAISKMPSSVGTGEGVQIRAIVAWATARVLDSSV